MRTAIGLAARRPLAAAITTVGVLALLTQMVQDQPAHGVVAAGVLLLLIGAAGLAPHDEEDRR